MTNNTLVDVLGIENDRFYWLQYFLDVTIGGAGLAFSLIFFGFVLYMECNKDLTPRIANRPKGVLKRAIFHHLPAWMNTPFFYPVAWIGWAYQLTYTECYNGIPGTGTRKDGKEGPLLTCNLDTIIMMRYHALLFKVGVLVFVLCTFVILPVNTTADCDPQIFRSETCEKREIAVNNSFFAYTTIDNIPDKVFNNTIEFNDIFLGLNEVNSTASLGQFIINQIWQEDQTWRVAVTVFSCLIIYIYTLYLLAWEWVENIALRREYYMEAPHYSKRLAELNEMTFEKDQRGTFLTEEKSDLENGSQNKKSLFGCCRKKNDDLPEHLTHPEITETPPSVGIFSVLYQFPSSMVTFDTEGATTVERQLVAATNFFDEIVPADPGFSSSVAAVTVLPNAKLLAKAKAKWNACEKKLQQLRYIRQKLRIAEKKHDGHQQKERERQKELGSTSANDNGGVQGANTTEEMGTKSAKPTALQVRPTLAQDASEIRPTEAAFVSSITDGSSNHTSCFRYDDFDVMEYAQSIGFDEEVNNTAEFVQGMDIEEFNVFAFKCAEIAGKNLGCDKLMLNHGVETLRDMETEILDEIRQANEELLQARKDVAMFADERELEQTNAPLPPPLTSDDDENGIERGRHLSPAMLRRRASIRSMVSVAGTVVSAASTLRRDQTAERSRNVSRGTASKPKASFVSDLWAALKCIVLVPKRLYCGKEGRNEFRKQLKYYGTKDAFDTESGRSKAFATNLDHPSYVVVTFTSRYAAVVARQCLADGSSRNRWKQVDGLPLYPLADAPPWLIMAPVTPTISFASKKVRRWIVLIAATIITVCNVYILDLISTYILKPDNFLAVFGIGDERARSWSSTASGLVQTLLFSVAPYLFEALANMEGSATSAGKAQRNAILYFWYFYVVARFMGKIVWDAVLSVWAGSGAEESITEAITQLSRTATLSLGPLAWTYIIYSCTLTWPLIYFLQLFNLSTGFFRLNFINRQLKKGGPGIDAYYRIYVDSGYVFACMSALAPICPLLGFACLLYFVIITPMLRWVMVFTFRPRWDGGGDKWPRLHMIIVSSLILGQIITSVTLFLKGNNLEGFFIGFLVIPTLLYNSIILEKFLRPYQEAALLQTRRVSSDGYSSNNLQSSDSWIQQEEYRRWLVDCHKASYLPTCLSGGKENLLTAEPAIVISEAQNEDLQKEDEPGTDSNDSQRQTSERSALLKRQKAQKGGILRRQRFNLY